MASSRFGWSDFFMRLLFALVLVLATYNPEGYSYIGWALRDISEFTPVKALVGVILIVGWTIYLRATFRSLGMVGLILALAVFGSLAWVLIDVGLVSAGSMRAVTYLLLLVTAAIMAVGISWSHVRRRLSGQYDMDDVDE